MTWIDVAEDLTEIQKLLQYKSESNIKRVGETPLIWSLKAVLLLKLADLMPSFILPIPTGGIQIIFIKKSYNVRVNFKNDGTIEAEIFNGAQSLLIITVQPELEQLRSTFNYIKSFLKKPLDKAWE